MVPNELPLNEEVCLTIDELLDIELKENEEIKYGVVKAFVLSTVDTDYKICTNIKCKKIKIQEVNGEYVCLQCKGSSLTTVPQMKVKIADSDDSEENDGLFITAFGTLAAGQREKIKRGFTKFYFKIKISFANTYNDKSKTSIAYNFNIEKFMDDDGSLCELSEEDSLSDEALELKNETSTSVSNTKNLDDISDELKIVNSSTPIEKAVG